MKKAGVAAEVACRIKQTKYKKIVASNFKFVGVAFQTMELWLEQGDKRFHKCLCLWSSRVMFEQNNSYINEISWLYNKGMRQAFWER